MSEPEQPKANLVYLFNLLDVFEEDVKTRNEAKLAGKALGATLGLPKIDKMLGGFLAPGLHVLHGAPAVGKSALALQIAATCGCPCIYITCEMSTLECFRRVVARTTLTYVSKFKSGEMSSSTARNLAKRTIEASPYLAILDASKAPAKAAHLIGHAKDVREQLGNGNPHLLIIIDSVHSWVRGIAGSEDEYTALNEGLRELIQLAQTLDIAILGISERNRATIASGGQNASAGTRSFEYSAESVLELDYEDAKKKTEDAKGDKRLKLSISKNRHGKTGGEVILLNNPDLMTFTEVDR